MFGDVSVDLLVSSGYGKCVSDVERYVGRANQGRIVYLILEFRSSVYQVISQWFTSLHLSFSGLPSP